MSATAQVKPNFDGPEDRQLADDIARAMHHRPLMRRLARVESSHTAAADFVAKTATHAAPAVPHAMPPAVSAEAASPPPVLDPRSLDEVIDDLSHIPAPPPSAAWLENARRAHAQARLRHALAWVTTLGIAISIIGAALLFLRA